MILTTLPLTARVERLRRQSLDAVPSISAERARIATAFYREHLGRHSTPVLRALNFKAICTQKTLWMGDGELIVGERGPAPKAVPTYPELTCHSAEDLRILDRRPKTAYRVADEVIAEYERDIIPFWRGRSLRDQMFDQLPAEGGIGRPLLYNYLTSIPAVVLLAGLYAAILGYMGDDFMRGFHSTPNSPPFMQQLTLGEHQVGGQHGFLVAMEDRCPHRLVPLSTGRVINDTVECGYHGLRFNAEGRCAFVPGQDNLPKGGVKTFPIAERHALVWLWFGAADLADGNQHRLARLGRACLSLICVVRT